MSRRRATAALDAASAVLREDSLKFSQQLSAFTIVFAGELFVTGTDGRLTVNVEAQAWLGLQDADWLGRVRAATADSSENGIFISLAESSNVTWPLPLRDDGSTIGLAQVQRFVQRWNNTYRYFSEGIMSATDLPAGYDSNFIAYNALQ